MFSLHTKNGNYVVVKDDGYEKEPYCGNHFAVYMYVCIYIYIYMSRHRYRYRYKRMIRSTVIRWPSQNFES